MGGSESEMVKDGSHTRIKSPIKRSSAAAFASPESKKKKKTDLTNNVEEAGEAQEMGVDGLKPPVKLWTETQEIEILNGMIEYMRTKGTDPMADKDDLYVFIMESFTASEKPTVQELVDKIKRLKKKYLDKRRNFSKPHDLQCYELVKILWPAGSSVNGSTKVGKNKQLEGEVPSSPIRRDIFQENGDGPNHIALGGPLVFCNSRLADQVLMDAADLVTGSRKIELEEERKNLKLKGIELLLMETDFLRKQAELVMDSIKSHQA